MLTERKPAVNKRYTQKDKRKTNGTAFLGVLFHWHKTFKEGKWLKQCPDKQRKIIPWPLSKNSVMYRALHGDHGRVLLRWMKKGAIIWCPLRCPNHFSQFLESSCGMLSTWPEKRRRKQKYVHVQCNNFHTLLCSSIWLCSIYLSMMFITAAHCVVFDFPEGVTYNQTFKETTILQLLLQLGV